MYSTPQKFRMRTKLAVWFVLLTVLATVVLTITLFISIRGYLRRSTQQKMLDIVSLAALHLDADLNASLIDPQQENSAEYAQIKRILQDIRNTNSSIRYIYTARYFNNQEIFIVDAEEDPQLVSHLGDVYQEALPSALSIMATATKPYLEPEINTDQWGTWITSCAPLFLSNGGRGDFLCMDMSASDMYNQERQFLWLVLAILVGMLPFVIGIGWFIGDRLSAPLAELISGTLLLAQGELQHRVKVKGQDEIAALGKTFNGMADRLDKMVNTLEEQVEERTQEVVRRSNFLTAAAEVGRVANTILDTDLLSHEVIELIHKQFDLFYVGLYLMSEDGQWAMLRAGTGELGRALINRQHRIAVGEGTIGLCISNGESMISHGVAQDDSLLLPSGDGDMTYLPSILSEAALPLFIRGRIIGALTVLSETVKTFDETAMLALQAIADQLAVALDNARLYSESRKALDTAQKTLGNITQWDWMKVFNNQPNVDKNHPYGYYGDQAQILPLDERGQELSHHSSPQVLHLSIRVRGHVIGTIHARKPETAGTWNSEETALLETLIDQLSIALDNARLYRDTLRRAERDRMVADITNKMRRAVDMDTLIQTTVQEISKAIHVPEAFLQLHVTPTTSENNSPTEIPHDRG